MRLRRARPTAPGYTRRRSGRGFRYLDESGQALRDPEALARIHGLVIPPAWRDVWICPDPAGHIQAIGTDAAGRRQYLYHEQWRTRQDRRKFAHVQQIAGALPRLRRRVRKDLAESGLTRTRVLALAARLIDRGLFRVGSDEYAGGDDPTYGVATLQVRHATGGDGRVRFRYRAKGGLHREIEVADAAACAAILDLCAHRRGRQRLLAFPEGGCWREVHRGDVNDYLRAASGTGMTAKDLRTWKATVFAALALADAGPAGSPTAARRVVAGVMRAVAEDLGNTPAVARSAYVDPRVVELYHRGITVPARRPGPGAERAVLDLLDAGGAARPDSR